MIWKLPLEYRNLSFTAPSIMYFKPVLESPHWLYYCMCQEFSVSVAPLFCEGLSCHGSISKEYCMIVKGTSCNLLSLKYTLFKLRETYFSIQSPLKSAPVVNNILPKLLKNLNVCILYMKNIWRFCKILLQSCGAFSKLKWPIYPPLSADHSPPSIPNFWNVIEAC